MPNLYNPQTQQTVTVNESDPDYGAYLAGGFIQGTAASSAQLPTASSVSQVSPIPTQQTNTLQSQQVSGSQMTPQFQILNPDAMGQYNPSQYERLPTGEVVLKAGVQPIEGTVKQFGQPSPLATPQQNVLPPFTLPEVPKIVPSTMLEDFKFEVGVFRKEQQEQRERLQEMLLPTQRESTLRAELSRIRGEARDIELSARGGIQDVKEKTIGMGFIVGEARNIEERANLLLQTKSEQERRIIEELGLEQEARKSAIDSAKLGLEFSEKDLDTQFKMVQLHNQEIDKYNQQVNQLRDDARQALNVMLTQFGGFEWKDLNVASQSQIAELAQRAGFPLEVLTQGMTLKKENQIYQQELSAERLAIQQERLLLSQARAGGGSTSLPQSVNDYVDLYNRGLISSATQIPIKIRSEVLKRVGGGENFAIQTEINNTALKLSSGLPADPLLARYIGKTVDIFGQPKYVPFKITPEIIKTISTQSPQISLASGESNTRLAADIRTAKSLGEDRNATINDIMSVYKLNKETASKFYDTYSKGF